MAVKQKHFEEVRLELERYFESCPPISDLFEMYRKLIKYAQSFERIEKYRSEMEPRYEEAISEVFGNCIDRPEPQLKLRFEDLAKHIHKLGRYEDGNFFESPYKLYTNCHPSESGLIFAGYA